MVCDLEPAVYHDEPVWRVGHALTPWRFTDWAYADTTGRFGDDVANVALFELPDGHDLIADAASAPVGLDDPDLQAAMAHHRLSWFDDPAS